TPYIVMELLHGETLADRLARGPLSWPQAAAIGGQVAGALAAAHAQGVVHQDIKPANIMLTPSGVKVLDFGIAAVTGRREDSHWIIGTPAYAPPERLRQVPPDPSADVFGLGAVLVEMVSGRKPWPIESWEDAQRSDHALPALPPSVPAPAAAVIREALDPSPLARPTSSFLAQVLKSPDRTMVAPAGGLIAGSAAVPPRSAHATQIYHPPAAKRGRSPAVVAGVALLALILVIGGIFFLTRALRPDPSTVTTLPTGSPVTQARPAPASSPTPAAQRDAAAILLALRQAVDAGESAGQIDSDKAKDLRKEINEIDRKGRGKDFTAKIEDTRRRIDDLAEDGELAAPLRQTLFTLLDELERQATLR
uniref:protein kinase domain-containing protein n=1 Tax=Allorhizocola rhizosphaerae TaxID=1872709 RepID=UPI0013C35D6F